MKHFFDAGILILSFLLVWLFQEFSLMDLTVPLLGLLMAIYLVTSFLKATNSALAFHDPLHAFLLTTIILLLIVSTGSLTSPFYFLLYFLLFGLSFLLNPASSITFAALSCLFFLPNLIATDYIKGMLQIGSFITVSPLAYYCGAEYQEHIRITRATERLVNAIAKDISKIINDDSKVLTNTETKALTDMLNKLERAEDVTGHKAGVNKS